MLYAAYGSNLHPDRLGERVPSAKLCGSSHVDGWGLRFDKRGQDDSAKCNMVSCLEVLYVAVYEIDPVEKPYLDTAEGLGHGYLVKEIHVPDYGACFLYVGQDSHIDSSLRPYEWYKELVLAGCEYHGFPMDYVGMVQRVVHCEDPDINRHQRWMRFVNTIQQTDLP